MKANELRLGNWVYDGRHTRFPMYVTGFSEDGYVTLNFPGNEGMDWEADAADLEGVQLTEGFLSKMGFEQKGVVWKHIGSKAEMHFTNMNILEITFYDYGMVCGNCKRNNVRYVHEIQNLYQDITQQQLKIDLCK